jgi:hypothetical protein
LSIVTGGIHRRICDSISSPIGPRKQSTPKKDAILRCLGYRQITMGCRTVAAWRVSGELAPEKGGDLENGRIATSVAFVLRIHEFGEDRCRSDHFVPRRAYSMRYDIVLAGAAFQSS